MTYVSTVRVKQLMNIPLRRENIDSHMDNRVYKEGQKPRGDNLSICLKKVVDK